MSTSHSSVRVAVRVRPLTSIEKQQQSKDLITFIPNQPQLNVGSDRSFTFDYVYPPFTQQSDVFNTCVIPLVNKYIDGYNATILAYGQTGSGKSFSMGIGTESVTTVGNDGIVPRFIDVLFEKLKEKNQINQFEVYVSFLELYNEDIIDLLSPFKKENPNLSIREDHLGNIHWYGVREEKVANSFELLELLKKGTIARRTASTDMNHNSSRSHAIFSVILKQTIYETDLLMDENNSNNNNNNNQLDTSNSSSSSSSSSSTLSVPKPTENIQIKKSLISKFHFVDLAGSERLKRTNAVGDRAKEGISINSGLLALGNVISALGDESRKASHIPYRDSKLTRLLQDSLGGNSQTLMLACVSPADINQIETLNTLKYANRARNIRNRVTINQEKVNESDKLKQIIIKLKEEMRTNDEFMRAVNDEMDGLKLTVQHMEKDTVQMATELGQVKCERDLLKKQIHVNSNNNDTNDTNTNNNINIDDTMQQLLNEYTQTIEQLKLQLQQSQRQSQSSPQQQKKHPKKNHHQNQSQPQPQKSNKPSSLIKKEQTKVIKKSQDHSLLVVPEKTKTTDGKKKRHSIRIGSLRRSGKGRRRLSFNNNNNNSNNNTNNSNNNNNHHHGSKNIKQIKSEIQQDKIYLKATQASLDCLELNTPTEELNKDLFPSFDHGESNGHESSTKSSASKEYQQLARDMIQRFYNNIESKTQLMHQLERVEQKSRDTNQHLEKKLKESNEQQDKLIEDHKKYIEELNKQNEIKQRKQLTDLQTLRRKHTQLVNSTSTMRTQQENTIRNLKSSLEDAKHEKMKVIKRMKQELTKSKEKCQQYEKEIEKQTQVIEKQSNQSKKKWDKEISSLKSSNKKLLDENKLIHSQIKQITTVVKKALVQEKIDPVVLAKAITNLTPSSIPHPNHHSTTTNASSTTTTTTTTTATTTATTNTTNTTSNNNNNNNNNNNTTTLPSATSFGFRHRSQQQGQNHSSSTTSSGKRYHKKNETIKFVTLQQKVMERKRFILRAINAFARCQLPTKYLNELYEKRNRFIQEQKELMKERDLVIEDEIKNNQKEKEIIMIPQYMDERIDTLTTEIDLLNNTIYKLESSYQPYQQKIRKQQQQQQQQQQIERIDEDWVDIVDQDIHVTEMDDEENKNAKAGYEIALSLIKTLEADESKLICESLLDDFIQLKQDYYVIQLLSGHLNTTISKHQELMVQLRRKLMYQDEQSLGEEQQMIIEDYYQRMFYGSTKLWNGMILLNTSNCSLPSSLSSSPSLVSTKEDDDEEDDEIDEVNEQSVETNHPVSSSSPCGEDQSSIASDTTMILSNVTMID